MRAFSVTVTAIAFLGVTACRTGPDVVRLKDGHMIDGRWISAEAYARFLDGAVHEASGDDANAALAYAAALAEDPSSAGILARLGAVRCTTNPASADEAFTRAEHFDPELADAWLAHAECELRRGNAKAATRSALRAAALSPNDVETSLVVARAFEETGDSATAARWLSALALRRPGMVTAEQAVEAQATRTGDRGREAKAETALADVFAELDARPAAEPNRVTTTEGSAEPALRAVSAGSIPLALDIAARVLSAEPGNVDAKVAALAAADLSREPLGLAKQLAALPHERTELGALAARLMADLLGRRSGERAVQAWVAATGMTSVIAAPEPSAPNLRHDARGR